MSDNRPSARIPPANLQHKPIELDDPVRALRELGSRAHQLRAATTAADRFMARDEAADKHTASWLISGAVALSADLAADIDSLARSMKDRPADSALMNHIAALRVGAHQLSAATRAADHFLDQDSREDRDTGSWLVATALTMAQKLASAIDDSGQPATRRPPVDKSSIEPHDPVLARRMAAATTPLRGAA
jgi:hypothetical protein